MRRETILRYYSMNYTTKGAIEPLLTKRKQIIQGAFIFYVHIELMEGSLLLCVHVFKLVMCIEDFMNCGLSNLGLCLVIVLHTWH